MPLSLQKGLCPAWTSGAGMPTYCVRGKSDTPFFFLHMEKSQVLLNTEADVSCKSVGTLPRVA